MKTYIITTISHFQHKVYIFKHNKKTKKTKELTINYKNVINLKNIGDNMFNNLIIKIILALILTPVVMVVFNNYTGNSIIKMISMGQESSIYKKLYTMKYPCDRNSNIQEDNGIYHIFENKISDNLGSCFGGKLKNINTLEIDTNYGGRITSALIIADEVKKRKIDVFVKNECYSSCVDILMHGNNRMVCDNAFVGIHQQAMSADNKYIKEYLKRLQEFSLQKYKNTGIDIDMIKEIIDDTPNDSMYELSSKELLETGIATEIISCQ